MTGLEAAFSGGGPLITCELNPPKGTDLRELVTTAQALRSLVHGFNLTDSAAARMAMDPTVAGFELLKRNIEPIVQISSRDKNRLALQSGMLGAAVLGIRNLVVMGGDPPSIGDHPQAKGVSDLFASQIIEAAVALNGGHDLSGNPLSGQTDFFVGAVFNPGAEDMAAEIDNTRRKIDAGAAFFQTQAIYEVGKFTSFMEKLNAPEIKVLAGIIPIKSVKMATYMNEKIPGIDIPENMVRRIAAAEQSASVVDESLDIASRIMRDLGAHCRGFHIMALGWERHLGALLERMH